MVRYNAHGLIGGSESVVKVAGVPVGKDMPKLLQAQPGVLLCENATLAPFLLAQHPPPKPGRSQAASVASTPDEPADAGLTAYPGDLYTNEAEDAQSSSGDILPEQAREH